MKNKKATILMSVLVMLLSLTMAVSCNQNVAGEADRLVRVSLADGSRGLSYQVVDNSKNVDDLYWYYSATKGAGYFRTGETAWGTITKADGKLEGADLGLFSQGDWTFTFWGFATEQSRTAAPDITPGSSFDPKAAGLYYYAVGVAKTLSEDEEYLDITLTPGFAIETKVIFQNLVFDPDQNTGVKTSGAALTLKAYEGGVEYLDFGTVPAVEGVYKFASTAVEKTYTSDFGYHDLAFTVTCGTEEVASEELRIYVREGLVTTITGDLSSLERRSDVVIRTVTADKITYNATAIIETGVEKSIALDATGNSVTFPADTLSAGNVTLTVDKKDAGSFAVAAGETGILALDLSAAQTDGVKSQFAVPVLVSWYIGEGYTLADLAVVYTGDSTLSQPTIESYENGVLTFSTDHFSEFVVKIKGVALLNDKAYGSVSDAVAAVKETEGKKGTITLLNDVDDSLIFNGGVDIVLDLGGHTLTLDGFTYLLNAKLSVKNGTIDASSNSFYIYGLEEGDPETYVSVLSFEKDAVLDCEGFWGIILCALNGDARRMTLNVDGTLKGDDPIWVHGNLVSGDSKINILENARIIASGPGIALNGFVKVTVEDGAEITGSETAIEVRAGELVVKGGTFKSTSAAFSCKPNGSGTTTAGAAIAVAQHTTKLPISVTIKGGTFEGIVGFYQGNPQKNVYTEENQPVIALNGGTFKSTENGGIAVGILDAKVTTSASVVYQGKWASVINGNSGKCYSSLAAAVADAAADDTVYLVSDVTLANDLTIDKALTIEGNGNAVISGKTIHTKADVTFRNLTYQNPTNASSNASMFYGETGTTELVLEGCTFANPQWEVVQYIASDMKKLVVKDCTFTAANVAGVAEAQYGSAANQAIRYLHIQPTPADGVEIEVTGNTFQNCDKIKEEICGFYYISGQLKIGNNVFEDWADGDVDKDGNSKKLTIEWPAMESLKAVSKWTGDIATYEIAPK